jgi:hypothetical protein
MRTIRKPSPDSQTIYLLWNEREFLGAVTSKDIAMRWAAGTSNRRFAELPLDDPEFVSQVEGMRLLAKAAQKRLQRYKER